MASCASCNRTIIFGGKKLGERRFCNDKCLQKGQLRLLAEEQVTEEDVRRAVEEMRNGNCPLCRGMGPNEAYVAHRIWSAVRFSSWRSEARISCARCGTKRQINGIIFSTFLGWWSIYGIFVTPMQIYRNIRDLRNPPEPAFPSDRFKAMVREQLAARRLAEMAPPSVK